MTTTTDLQRMGQEFDGGWQTCRIGSCHRHEECMYHPCRSVGPVDLDADLAGYRQAQAEWLRANGWIEDERGWSMERGFCKPLSIEVAHELAMVLERLDTPTDDGSTDLLPSSLGTDACVAPSVQDALADREGPSAATHPENQHG